MDNAYLDENYLTRREGLFRVRLTARTTVSGKYVYSGYEVIPDPTALAGLALANPGRSFDPTACPLFEINNTEVSVSGEPIVWARLRSSEGGVPSYEFDSGWRGNITTLTHAARNVAGIINTTNNQVLGLGSKVFAGTTAVTPNPFDVVAYTKTVAPTNDPTVFGIPDYFIGPGILVPNEWSIGLTGDTASPTIGGLALSEYNGSGAAPRELVFVDGTSGGYIAVVSRNSSGVADDRQSVTPGSFAYGPHICGYAFAVYVDRTTREVGIDTTFATGDGRTVTVMGGIVVAIA